MRVFDILTSKGIEVSEEESLKIQKQWEAIQSMRLDLDKVIKNDSDIALTHVVNGGKKHE